MAPGIITKEADGFKVVFERLLNHDIETVWDAITNPDKLKIWFTDIEMDLKAGSAIKIRFRDAAKTITHGRVISVNPPHQFVWTWEGELAVWDLQAAGKNKCKLTFTYSKMTDQYAVGSAGGFHTLLDRLELVLNGRQESYPFDTEEFDPVQITLRETYGDAVYSTFPQLQIYNPFKLERVFNVPVDKVWNAITDRAAMKQWYFDLAEDFRAEAGAEFYWSAGPPEGKQWQHKGVITEVIKGKKLAHTWEYPGYEGKAEVTWELTPISDIQTKLNLTFSILIPFDPREEALARKNFREGWESILFTSLPRFLNA
ncbi:MAG: SRPBCC domain-containing protein [Cyclobacteriaceae bacterium]|nr:SRPBCC domain-containing protein [Cyclobacteriaceae bacterium]